MDYQVSGAASELMHEMQPYKASIYILHLTFYLLILFQLHFYCSVKACGRHEFLRFYKIDQ